MPGVFRYESTVMLVIELVLLAVKIFAFVNSLMYTDEAYRAASKASKAPWSIGLGLGVLLQVLVPGILLVSIAFTIAAFVFLADVRPALMSLRRR